MDTPIREKTPLEIAAEKRREQAADSEQAFIRAMADVLSGLGYTRDNDQSDVWATSARYAIGHGIKALVEAGDRSFLGEFLSEGSEHSERAIFNALADFMIQPSDQAAFEAADAIARQARWYGESWLQRALDMLPSASEIQRDREVDQAIDERKSA